MKQVEVTESALRAIHDALADAEEHHRTADEIAAVDAQRAAAHLGLEAPKVEGELTAKLRKARVRAKKALG